MNKLIPVEGYSSLARDRNTRAIHNLNQNEIMRARARKANNSKSLEKIQELEKDIAHLKSMIMSLVEEKK